VRRAATILALAGATYAIGVVLLLIIFEWQFGFLGPRLLWSAFYRSGFWTVIGVGIVLLLRVRPRHWLVDALFVTSTALAAGFVSELAYMIFLDAHGWISDPRLTAHPPARRVVLAALTATLEPFMVLLCSGMAMRWIRANDEKHSRAVRLNQLETRLSEARLRLLRSQLHPHFLFNALNSLAVLIRHDRERAVEMLSRLSRFYSVAEATDGRQFVTLGEEIGFLREYLAIEQVRFGPRLTCEIDVEDAALGAAVPTLILQPLIENAIKHGVARVCGPASLSLRARRMDRRLLITIENNGEAPAVPRADGVGMANTRARLRQFYGNDVELAIEPADGHTTVRVAIPMSA
jgi:hypothetical protein